MEIMGGAPFASPWDTTSQTTDSSAIQGLPNPSTGELADGGQIENMPMYLGEELGGRPSLHSPFDPQVLDNRSACPLSVCVQASVVGAS